jgi:hypothetical protein
LKTNLKLFFKYKTTKNLKTDNDNIEYDKHVNFYYQNLINSLILFSYPPEILEKLSEPKFDPLFELESEVDYAFTPVCFETIFRNGLIDNSLRHELLTFKSEVDDISSEIWDWGYIDKHEKWISTRQKANSLLDKLGVTIRTFNKGETTFYVNE